MESEQGLGVDGFIQPFSTNVETECGSVDVVPNSDLPCGILTFSKSSSRFMLVAGIWLKKAEVVLNMENLISAGTNKFNYG